MQDVPKFLRYKCSGCGDDKGVLRIDDGSAKEASSRKCDICGTVGWEVITEKELHDMSMRQAELEKARAEARKAKHAADHAAEQTKHEEQKRLKTEEEKKTESKKTILDSTRVAVSAFTAAASAAAIYYKIKNKN